jgi:predicted transcriptional regulator
MSTSTSSAVSEIQRKLNEKDKEIEDLKRRISELEQNQDEDIEALKNKIDELNKALKQDSLKFFLVSLSNFLSKFQHLFRHVIKTLITIYIFLFIANHFFSVDLQCIII